MAAGAGCFPSAPAPVFVHPRVIGTKEHGRGCGGSAAGRVAAVGPPFPGRWSHRTRPLAPPRLPLQLPARVSCPSWPQEQKRPGGGTGSPAPRDAACRGQAVSKQNPLSISERSFLSPLHPYFQCPPPCQQRGCSRVPFPPPGAPGRWRCRPQPARAV